MSSRSHRGKRRAAPEGSRVFQVEAGAGGFQILSTAAPGPPLLMPSGTRPRALGSPELCPFSLPGRRGPLQPAGGSRCGPPLSVPNLRTPSRLAGPRRHSVMRTRHWDVPGKWGPMGTSCFSVTPVPSVSKCTLDFKAFAF